MSASSDFALRVQGKLRALCGAALHHARTVCAPLGKRTRQILIQAGLPLKKQFLALPCMTGHDTSGLFTEFLAVLGALSQHEQWRSIYAGLRVDYADQGLYYDPSVGPNWWEYYFERIDVGAMENAMVKVVDPHEHDMLTYGAAAMSRAGAHELIAKYVRLKPHIRQKLDSYLHDNFEDAFVVGLHYRGTDKHEEAPRVEYDDVAAVVRKVLDGAKTSRHKVFVATDEQAFLDYMVARFPDELLYRAMFRSKDGRPIDVTNDDSNYQKGEDAILDCLLLSRTDCLIRTASNLSLCSAFFDPDMPEIVLSRPYYAPA